MSAPPRAKQLVLVLDPYPQEAQLTAQALEPFFKVSQATSANEARQLIQSFRPSIVLVELDIPDNAGLSLIHTIRQSGAKEIGIACVTRKAAVADKVAAFQAGADDYIVKPIKVDSLPYRLLLLSRIRQFSLNHSSL